MEPGPPSKSPHLRRSRLALILLAVFLLLAVGLGVGLRKSVSLTIDGVSSTITTYAVKVSNLLFAEHISLSPIDELSPPANAWLKNGSQVTLVHAIPVQILADGRIHSSYSAERVPARLIAQSSLKLSSGDLVLSNGRQVDPNLSMPAGARSISLQIIRSVRFTLTTAGSSQSITSTASSLGSALWQAGHFLYAADLLNPPPGTPLAAGLEAALEPSQPVVIHLGNTQLEIRTSAATVGAALEDAGVSIQGLDYSLPSPQDPVPADREIRLVRVTEEVLVEQSPIEFETQYQAAPEVEIDTQAVLQPGEVGQNAQRVRVRYEDGQEVSRQVEDQWVARQPVARIIGYGTMLVMHTAEVDGVQIQYWRSLSMYATSYHPSEGGGGTTASGLPLKKGVAAIDLRYIPFFTQMYVPGYGEVVAADVGGGVIGRWIDLGYSDSDYVPWHAWVTVYFLWPPPDNIVWIIP